MVPQSSIERRRSLLGSLEHGNGEFDLVVIGGGITGAGVAREAAGSGLRTLLVEQADFAWGTSSRSSKMVHGGLRYLAGGHYALTREAVRERQRLLDEAPGLVDPLHFVMPHYQGEFPGPKVMAGLLWAYDALAGRKSRQRLSPGQTLQWAPGLSQNRLVGASGFTDAVTDDARLVLRVLAEARKDGALCLNYVRAVSILRNDDGEVRGVALEETGSGGGKTLTVTAPLVINATGAWAGNLRPSGNQGERIRPLRGSHLVLPFQVLPVSCSVACLHPEDRRPVFVFPWQGKTVLGTTDLDHEDSLDREPVVTESEIEYLLAAARKLFPGSPVEVSDIVSSWSGVRPVVTQGKSKGLKPSKENREHVIWQDQGLISIAGGKLTTFRVIAREVLNHATHHLPDFSLRANSEPVFAQSSAPARPDDIGALQWRRLHGFYGDQLPQVLNGGSIEAVPDSDLLWAEVVWAASNEDVIHLDDLMLRRTRLGLTLQDGGYGLLPQVKQHCLGALGWDGRRWQKEVERYLALWKTAYSIPDVPTASGAPF
ncbi:glycerol-3-phosphate dehydrogenase/oxidase [Marinobacter salicampi]|uniref:glycerol-3-phosphate dehydrogenase/oxidase n=1 Tax=Marinobacter salicampi TaxID=435907 RepID=UPI00140D0856|nr:glycerol-3-phosphate dehydrogenase/oxidase [Marinobacter salicampi]